MLSKTILVVIFCILKINGKVVLEGTKRQSVDVLKSNCDNEETHIGYNIGFVLSGYNIYFGNPIVTRPATIDPGYRLPIYKAEYNGSTTQDQQHCIPEGMSVLSCGGTCVFDFSTTKMNSTKTYLDTLTLKAGVTGPIVNGSFAASFDYHHVEVSTASHSYVFTQSETSCCVYSALLKDYGHPKFDPDFVANLNDLPDNYDASQYFRLIDNYGTHYIKQADMGALFGEQSMITTENYNEMVGDGIDIGLYAGYSAVVNVNATFGSNVVEAAVFRSYTHERKIYSKGVTPPENLQSSEWMSMTYENPMPMKLRLASIDTLPNIENLVSTSALSNLKLALSEYCPKLLLDGKVESCDPPEDNPLPKPRTWTKWSNVHDSGHEVAPQACDEGQYIEKMQWAKKHYGLDNLKIKCSGKNVWNDPIQHWSENGWEDIMDCSETGRAGFRDVAARDVGLGWDRIVNVRAFCFNSEIEIRSNDDMRGSWNPDLKCQEGQQFVGVQLSYLTGHGFENFRWLCA